MSWTEPLPEWNAAGTEPPQSKKDDGWQAEEKPPAGWFNWLFGRIYACLVEIRSAFAGLASSPHALGGDDHSASTLANLNAKISDANLDAAGSARPPASHANEAHSTEMAAAADVAAKFHATTGHKHTGAAGDAPQLAKANVGLGNVDNVQQAPLRLAINARTSSYTLALSDGDGKLVTMSSASAQTITVPPNSTVAFPIGTQILIQRLGTGDVTLVAGSGVTLQSADSALKLREQYSVAGLVKRDTDTWAVCGDVGE